MLTIQNLTFGYNGTGKLFSDLSLNLEKGNIYGLLGRNGAGKTTLLKVASGLLYAHKGHVSFKGLDVSMRQPKFLADVYIIPEEFQLPDFRAMEYVSMFSPFYPKFDKKRMNELLLEMEVDKSKKLNSLSYGQKKKFIIAFAVATNCSLVVMDEPTNGLDIPSKSKFRRIIASSIDENRSYLISTHQVRDLESLIDPVVMIENGNIIFNERMDTIASRLSFVNTTKDDVPEGKAFHKEPIFGGEYMVTENNSGIESPVDFELLFNAVLSNQNEIVEHLKA
jgi:ABC-2 type transport system ATP-binding protein